MPNKMPKIFSLVGPRAFVPLIPTERFHVDGNLKSQVELLKNSIKKHLISDPQANIVRVLYQLSNLTIHN
jgi:hypothetical protein